MAIYPLVWGSDGRPRPANSGDTLLGNFTEVDVVPVSNATGGSLVKLSPVYKTTTSSQVGKARANASGTSNVLGLLAADIADGNSGSAQTDGKVTGSNSEWQAVVTGNGGSGLTPGDELWLDEANAGKLRVGPPTAAGSKLVRVGTCISSTEVELSIHWYGSL